MSDHPKRPGGIPLSPKTLLIFLAILLGLAAVKNLTLFWSHSSRDEASSPELELVESLPQTGFKAHPAPKTLPGDMAVTKADGTSISLNALPGKLTVVNFWATWCAPCVKEIPTLLSLAEKLKGDGIGLLAISIDREHEKAVEPFLKEKGFENFPVAYDREMKVSRALKAYRLPSTLIVNDKGQELARIEGAQEWDSDEAISFLKGLIQNP